MRDHQSRYRTGGKYRNLAGDGGSGADANPPPIDCNPNNMASSGYRRAHGKTSGRSTAGGITDAPDGADSGPAGGIDCSKNQLASNNYDRFKKRP